MQKDCAKRYRPTDMWSEVLDALLEINMFRGIYDAKNGSEHFMYGITTVMEFIAEKANRYEEYDEIWMAGIEESLRKAGKL